MVLRLLLILHTKDLTVYYALRTPWRYNSFLTVVTLHASDFVVLHFITHYALVLAQEFPNCPAQQALMWILQFILGIQFERKLHAPVCLHISLEVHVRKYFSLCRYFDRHLKIKGLLFLSSEVSTGGVRLGKSVQGEWEL